jgi:hypothetical protein
MDGCSSCQVPKAPPKLPRAPKAPKRLHWAPLPSPEQVGSESKGTDTFRKVHHAESCRIMFIILRSFRLGFRDVSFDSLQMVLFFPSPKLGSQSWWSARPLDEPARVMGASTMFFFKSTPKKNGFHWGHIMFPCSMGILCLSQNSLA